MNKLWKKFEKLSSKCYANMEQSDVNLEDWDNAFSVLMEIIKEDAVPELYLLDDRTDYQFDVCGWLDDYLDELEILEKNEEVQSICEQLLGLFKWEEEDPGELNFRIASAMREQGKKEEAHAFCERWYQKNTEDVLAATALIYAKIAIRDYAGGKKLVDQYISEDTVCTEDNDIIFTAASLLYKLSGNKKAEKAINQAIQQYEEEIEQYFAGLGEDEMEFEMDDDDLPFH